GGKVAGRGVDEVAAFRDGQRDDADLLAGERADDCRGIPDRQVVDHRADDMGLAARLLLLDDRGQPILPREIAAHRDLFRPEAGADDREVAALPLVEKRVEIGRLVGAMKIADAEMDDPRREIAGAISGDGDGGTEPGQSSRRQGYGHGSFLGVLARKYLF